ncbi:hypothetical protein UFOVP257_386 [uncultured Caudovirales phage]|uniref:Uncharacterized protein n=1 Tax=uncultured Caudovirales phage TaxID=2100421 RepID=A0A6J5LGE9_9CAUD|nr:hypothetical protein UFOVP257_386 [uncultured Caudovirales phage]
MFWLLPVQASNNGGGQVSPRFTMKYKIEKLDKRHKGNDDFKYRVEFLPDSRLNKRFSNFQHARKWCWDLFGESSEREMYDKIKTEREITDSDDPQFNPVWCWHHQIYNGNGLYIYLKSDHELVFFQLKWSVDQK